MIRRLFFPVFAMIASDAAAQNPAAPAKPAEPSTPLEIKRAITDAVEVKPGQPVVAAAAPAGSEQKILKVLSQLSDAQLEELLEAYARLQNQRMSAPLIREILRRDPANKRARELMVNLSSAADFPDEPEAVQASSLILMGQHAQAARLLWKLKEEKYKNRPFRYQQDLAYALYSAGDMTKAQGEFRELAASSDDPVARRDAENTLRMMVIDALMRRGDAALSGKELDKAMLAADRLLKQNPNDADGIALKTSVWCLSGKAKQAVSFLMELKADYGEKFYPHQRALADALYEAKMYDDAKEAYMVVLKDKRFPADEKRDATLRIKDLGRDVKGAEAEAALKRKDLATAEKILAQMRATQPNHGDTIALQAAILMQRKDYATARRLLQELEMRGRMKGEFFDARPDLAHAQANTGAWGPAAAHFSLVENDSRYDRSTRYDAARTGRELRSRIRPTATQETTASSESEGVLWSSHSEFSTGIMGDTGSIMFVRGSWADIRLDNDRLISGEEFERYTAEVAYRKLWGDGYYGELSLGGSNAGFIGGVAVGHYEMPGTGWELRARFNEPATDSLHLMALDGTQDSVSLNIHRRLSEQWYLDATLGWRQVEVSGHSLGSGVDLDLNVGYTFLTETEKRPELALNYYAEIQYFDRRRLPKDYSGRKFRKELRGTTDGLEVNLIDETINRHGVMLTATKQFSHTTSAYGYAGIGYEFEAAQTEFRAGAGIESFFSKNAAFTLGYDYSSSGNAGNRGSDVHSVTAGVKISF